MVRVEDLDRARCVRGSEPRILADLQWLGLRWDTLSRQSDRGDAYAQAVRTLTDAGSVYPCDCSRADIAQMASAPHAGEETVYPGTCRLKDPERKMRRPAALRVRIPDGAKVHFVDEAAGPVEQDVTQEVGDFVLRRGDGTFAYQLAVLLDDVAAGITDVVRGRDLLSSTPRQLLLARMLDLEAPARYCHPALVVGSDGARLAKRTAGGTVRALREAGIPAEAILGALAHGLGLAPDGSPSTPEAILARAPAVIRWPTIPWALPPSWAAAAPAPGEA